MEELPAMPESFDPEAFDQAYRAVELSYSEGRFDEALREAEALLDQVDRGGDDPRTERLKLILGHIHLHGLRQPAQAVGFYQDVLDTGTTSTYIELAEQGLALCQEAFAQEAASERAFMAEKAVAPAMPWLLESATGQAAEDQDLSIEAVRVEELTFEPPGASNAPISKKSPPTVGPAEEAELAKGLLRVVLG
jgi:hypothetical protein